jgi:uncharacterized protein YfaS (alpha-2-macroglobulin family)
VTVSASGTPISGASVSVTVANPSGNVTTLSGITASNGVATLNYRLKKQAPAGTYQATARVASSGSAASTAPASTTFLVQ